MRVLYVVFTLCFMKGTLGDKSESPDFKLDPRNPVVQAGNTLVLQCHITNPTRIDPGLNTTIVWCQDNNTIAGSQMVKDVGVLEVTLNDSKPFYNFGCGIINYECKETVNITIAPTTTTTTTTTASTAALMRPTADRRTTRTVTISSSSSNIIISKLNSSTTSKTGSAKSTTSGSIEVLGGDNHNSGWVGRSSMFFCLLMVALVTRVIRM